MFQAFTFAGIDAAGGSIFGIATDMEGSGLPGGATWNFVTPVDLDEPVSIRGTAEPILSIKDMLGRSGAFWCPEFKGISGIR